MLTPRLLIRRLLVVAALPLCACRPADATQRQAAPAHPRRAVRTVAVTREPIAVPIRAAGLVAPREQATLSFKVGGIVRRVLVQPGELVRDGQLLAELDTREIDAQLGQAELQLQKARSDAARLASLSTSQAVSRVAAEDAANAARQAEAAVAVARFNRAHAAIVAPGRGRVARRLSEPNNVVAPGTPVLQLNVAASGYVVRVGLVDRDFVRVAVDDRAAVTLDAYPDRRFAGTVIGVAEEPSPLTGVYDVEVRLAEAPPRLLSGLVAKVELVPRGAERLAVVPLAALVDGDGHAGSVFVVDGEGRARRRRVETDHIIGETLAVRGELDAGERVVAEGASFIGDGELVRDVAP